MEACLADDKPGRDLVAALAPKADDYFVLKPMHSGFMSTTLKLLLDHLASHTLVIAGFATNICVMFTANDAHMHGFRVAVPSDCTAANDDAMTAMALEHVRVVLAADTCPSAEVDFAVLARLAPKERRAGV